MYPLVPLLGIAALKRERALAPAALALALAGASIAVYHYQLERFPSQSTVCDADAPCTVVWVWQLHYISIPLMALTGFLLVVALSLLALRQPEELSPPTRGDTDVQSGEEEDPQAGDRAPAARAGAQAAD
jgi:disulfide bond formation protein DsbB